MRKSLAAIKHVESGVAGGKGQGEAGRFEGLALRYGNLYGPGTGWSKGAAFAEAVRRRKLPIIGDGAGVWSFAHIDDAAIATIAAIERGVPGIYNIADDEPAPVSAWLLPVVTQALGADPPAPVCVARPARRGRGGISIFTKIRGASNVKANATSAGG